MTEKMTPTPDPAALAREARDLARAWVSDTKPGSDAHFLAKALLERDAEIERLKAEIVSEPDDTLQEARAHVRHATDRKRKLSTHPYSEGATTRLAREVLRLRGLIEWHDPITLRACQRCTHLGCMMARGESAPGEGE